MQRIKYHIIHADISQKRQIVRFSESLPKELLVCTGIKVSTGYDSPQVPATGGLFFPEQGEAQPEQFPPVMYMGQYRSAGMVAIEFDKKDYCNIPVLSPYRNIEHQGFFQLLLPLDETLITGYYLDNGSIELPYQVKVYLRCTTK